ncbi:hypothetical protein KIN20_000309 [Parelaphostrongylus tenuis]|uniref:Uncharacterized protein n=1 Tax=Parelaphostrongylus tenuis TaxID=148309 RepID=A0AAD5QFH1_PARTN|nr:hypothetical protein KIN20_000309 [Parelaphostrongylus tenuis]
MEKSSQNIFLSSEQKHLQWNPLAVVGQEESLLFIALGAIRGTEDDMDKVIHELARKTPLKVAEVAQIVNRLYGNISELRKDKKAMQKAYTTCTSDIFANYGCYRYMMDSRRHDKPTYGYYFGYTSRNMWGWLSNESSLPSRNALI